jgi:hypothetical protein
MAQFFTRERFGGPQFLAGLLLLGFLAQCGWLTSRDLRAPGVSRDEMFRLQEGLRQWHGGPPAGTAHQTDVGQENDSTPWFFTADDYDPYHSPMRYLAASAGLLVWPGPLQVDSRPYWGWLARAPFLIFGVLLGASLWYVSRRLYGNAGGYMALALYCFSPLMIRASAVWHTEPEIGAAWGAFGAIFTAIAVAHTLYAPREVVLWNWRRIVLLGLSLALAVGEQFSLLVLVPVALGFLLYLAPLRRGAATAIWAAGCGVAFVLLYASYFFRLQAFWEGLRHAGFGVSWQPFAMGRAYWYVWQQLMGASPALALAVPAALITYAVWPRVRYFGNTAPLLVAVGFLVLGMGTPHAPGFGFLLMAVPFVFVFVAGVCADLLETRQRSLVLACVWGLLAANALWSLLELAQV